MNDHIHEWKPALLFDSDDPEFARGVEVGLLWAGVEQLAFMGADRYRRQIHANNAEMALRVSEATGVPVRSVEIDDEWVEVIYESAGPQTGDEG